MKYLLLLLILPAQTLIFGQHFQATVNENYEIQVKKIPVPYSEKRNPNVEPVQLAGFPLAFKASPNNKNFRNVALADINEDGVEEILFAANNQFKVYHNSTLVWEKAMTGIGIYPPSIADIDGDGDLEIVQVTGGNGQKGRIYAMDHEGNNLSGFPKSYNDNWILTTASLSDLDGDGHKEIIFIERNPPGGNLHVISNKGEPWSNKWPIRIPGTPAVTPSIGDIDNDGNKEIVVSSTTILYAFNLEGTLEDGWPLDNPDTKFSFQSPVLADVDGDNDLEIIGATHGNSPEYYILNHDATPYSVWPFFVPEGEWTFSTPTVVEMEGALQIFMSRPKKGASLDMLYAWNEAGDLKSGFPIENEGGLEGIISIANIDADEEMELIFGSNRLDEEGFGYIHAFNMDGTGEVEGFPLRPKGWTLLNGAALGDIDNDGQMDLTALSYTTNFRNGNDSIYINTYNLETPYHPEKVLWSTYKGSNSRDGNMGEKLVSSIKSPTIEGLEIIIQPNPIESDGKAVLNLQQAMDLRGQIFHTNGQLIATLFDKNFQNGQYQIALPELPNGIFFLKISDGQKRQVTKRIISVKK